VRNPYEVLELLPNATEEEIRTAFRRLAAQHHPDRHQSSQTSQERFKEINGAYQTLIDPVKRSRYDRYGAAGFPGASGAAEHAGFEATLSDLLRAVGIRRGEGSISHALEVTFEEAALGCTKQIGYTRVEHCRRCDGTGAAEPLERVRCKACQGRGRVKYQEGLLSFINERACSKCHGTGFTHEHPCAQCRGKGLARSECQTTIEVPAGADHGSTHTVKRAGHRLTPGGPQGKLEVTLEVKPHPFFSRTGDDVRCRVPITIAQAALGDRIEVPSLEGKIRLTVPRSTQPGTILRIRGKGIPHRLRAGRGDQLVEIVVEVPAHLSDRAEDLMGQLADELEDESVQPARKSFADKLREFLEASGRS
jgi:molecular chaperone DnaJ